jgi:nucleoid DNA-binding protein
VQRVILQDSERLLLATEGEGNLLTKNELANRIAETGAGGPRQVKHVLDALAEVVQSEVAKGEGVTVPGVATIKFRYTSPLKKGEKYKKGDTYVGFGGVETVAEADSKARKQSVKLNAQPAPAIKRLGKDASVARKAISKAKR